MGQGLSCGVSHEHGLFSAVQFGDLETVESLLARDPSLLHQTTVYDRHSPLHIAAANGQIEVGFSVFLDFLGACLISFSSFGCDSMFCLFICFGLCCRFFPWFWIDLSVPICWIVTSKWVFSFRGMFVCICEIPFTWKCLILRGLLSSLFLSSLYCRLILLFLTDTDSAYACGNARKDFMRPEAPSSWRQCAWNSLYLLLF